MLRVVALIMVGLMIAAVHAIVVLPVHEHGNPIVPWALLAAGTGLVVASLLLRLGRLPDPALVPLNGLIAPALVLASAASVSMIGAHRDSLYTAVMFPLAAFCGVIAGGLLTQIATRDEIARLDAAVRRDRAIAIELYRRIARRRSRRVVSRARAFTIATRMFAGYNILWALAQACGVMYLMFEVGNVTGIEFRGAAKWACLVVASIAGWAASGVASSWAELRRATRAWDERPGLRILADTDVPALTAMIRDLGEAMLGTGTPFAAVVLDSYSRAAAPSVIAVGAEHRLIVTPRLVTLLHRAPQSVRAMIAHEIAHVVQEDAALWPRAMMLSRMTGDFIVPVVAWHAVTSFAAVLLLGSHDGLLIAIPNLVILATAYMAVRSSYEARRSSEALADLAAILFVDGPSLRDAIGGLSQVETDWHEHPKVRRARVERHSQ